MSLQHSPPAARSRSGSPFAAGVIAGGIAAIVAVLLSLELHSPDAVFLNTASVGLGALVLGGLAGAVWMGLAPRLVVFGVVWTLGLLLVIGASVGAETVLAGAVAFVAPLAVVSFAMTGALTYALTARAVGAARWAAPVVALVALVLGGALAGRAVQPAEGRAALPPVAATSALGAPTPPPAAVSVSPVPASSAPSAVAANSPVARAAASPMTVASPVARAPARTAGHYEGVNFAVGTGSKATFTVKEQLARMPLPNDAVVSTTAITGEVHLDGRPSTIQLDLQKLSSDQPNRDKYIHSTMFPQDRYATFTVDDVDAMPEGTAKGETVDRQVTGTLTIKGAPFPLTFDWQGRDDGDVFYMTGHTTFTWKDVGLEAPSSSAIVSADDSVAVDVVLAARPK